MFQEHRYAASQVLTQDGGVLTFAYEPGFVLEYHQAEPDLYKATSQQAFPLGTKYERGEQAYRYIYASASLTQNGGVGQMAAATANTVAAAAAGVMRLSYTGSDPGESQRYKGGYIGEPHGASAGSLTRVRNIDTTDNIIYLDEPLQKAFIAGDKLLLTHPYIVRASSIQIPVGIMPEAIAIGNFGWTQTKGFCRARAGLAAGAATGAYMHTDGDLHPVAAASVKAAIGWFGDAIVKSEYGLVKLSLD